MSKENKVTTEKNRQENKKAMKKLIPITIVAAVIGGFIGGFAVTEGVQGFSEKFKESLGNLVYSLAPWGVIIISAVGIVGSLLIYKQATKLYVNHLPEDPKEEIEEEMFDYVEHKISMGMILNSITMVVAFTLYGVVAAYLDKYFLDDKLILLVASILCFIITCFGQAKIQQMLVDFIKVMHPDKKGSTYDFKFSEKWEESCDELEKLMIYKSAYKAYKTTNAACCIALVVMILLSMLFHYGPMPAVVVGCIWLTQVLSYSLEAMKLDKK